MNINKEQMELERDRIYIYDEQNRLVDVVDTITNHYISSYKYEVVDGADVVTTTQYDFNGEVSGTSISRYQHGLLIQEDDRKYFYDDHNNLLKVEHEYSGSYELYFYKDDKVIKKEDHEKDEDGDYILCLSECDENGHIIKKTHFSRARGKHSKVRDIATYSYNGLGLLAEISSSRRQYLKECFYDKNNRLAVERVESLSGSSETNYFYDYDGLLYEEITNDNTGVTLIQYEYNKDKKLVRETAYVRKK